jgi:branched-chain amino acid aminotransferase
MEVMHMSEAVFDKFIFNGKLYDTSLFESTYRTLSPSVYEVIRVMDGTPLFLEEHYRRLTSSAASIGKKISFPIEGLKEYIKFLCKAVNIKNNNIKLVINDFKSSPEGSFYLFFLKSSYPTNEMYRDGVKTGLYNAVRENPNAKIINQSLRDSVNEYLKKNSLYEALLVNEGGNITEGSRSNIFFIKNDQAFTSPAEGVLLGVTRQRIIRLCRENSIQVHEEAITSGSLNEFDAAFISGTSPKVLPIAYIGDIHLSCSNDCLRKIMHLYDQEISNYQSLHKNN